MRRLPSLALLIALALLAGCAPAGPDRTSDVVVFVLDTPVDRGFVEGQVAGMRAEDVTHGSLVGRVVRSYCRAPIRSMPVDDMRGGLSRAAYLDGLRQVLEELSERPGRRAVVNISISSQEPDPEERALIERIIEAGALVVAAAGNDDAELAVYPAAYPGVVAVASATREGKSPASNWGRHVDIAASGDVTFIDYEFLPYEWLRRQTEAKGTSFAAPRVSAAVAYVLARRPALSPQEAVDVVARTAVRIDDERFARGLLGAGLLEMTAAKSAVTPAYRFTHFVLPVSLWVVLGVLCAYLFLRHGLVGVFATLLIWLVALPASILLVIELGRHLEFVGGGSVALGLGVAGIFAAALAVAAAVQGWQVPKALFAVGPPYLALLALRAWAPEAPWGALGGGALAAGVAIALALVWEIGTARRLALIGAAPASGPYADSERVIAAYGRAVDRRVRRACLAALGRIAEERAVDFLLDQPERVEAAGEALAQVVREEPSALLAYLGRFAELDEPRQERLLAAVRRAPGPAMLAFLEAAAGGDPTGRLRALIDSLGGQ